MRGVAWLVLAAVASACGPSEGSSPEAEAPTPEAEATTERWVRVERADDSPLLDFPARWIVDGASRAELGVPTSVLVRRAHVRPGDHVEAGAKLVSVTAVTLVEARGQKSAAETRIGALSERLTRLEELQGEGLVRGGDVADVRLRLAEARASREEATSRLDALRAAGLVLRGDYADLVAPFAGVVTLVAAPVGRAVDATSGPLVELSSAASRRLEARVPTTVRAERFVWVEGEGRPALRVVGESPELSEPGGLRQVWLEPIDSAVEAPAGAFARVRADSADAWVVPSEALVHGAGDEVRVRTRRQAEVIVEKRFELGSAWVVAGPLEEGDFVALRREAR